MKKVLVNNDGVTCEKCNKIVPIKYYLGIADDEMWVECIHTGWYCPNHSPTSSCDDGDCPCCEDPHYSDKKCAERRARGACKEEDCWCILWEEENGEPPKIEDWILNMYPSKIDKKF